MSIVISISISISSRTVLLLAIPVSTDSQGNELALSPLYLLMIDRCCYMSYHLDVDLIVIVDNSYLFHLVLFVGYMIADLMFFFFFYCQNGDC